jgi:hypothetical protein
VSKRTDKLHSWLKCAAAGEVSQRVNNVAADMRLASGSGEVLKKPLFVIGPNRFFCSGYMVVIDLSDRAEIIVGASTKANDVNLFRHGNFLWLSGGHYTPVMCQ